MDKFLKACNLDSLETVLSPSCRSIVVIGEYRSLENKRKYSQCSVYRKGEEKPLTIIQRKASLFHAFVIYQQQEYLIIGNSTILTIINLETGDKWDNITIDGFRASQYCPSPDGKTLAVFGYYFGSSDEWQFYDIDLENLSDNLSLPRISIMITTSESPYLGGEGKWVHGSQLIIGDETFDNNTYYFHTTESIKYNTKAKIYQNDVNYNTSQWIKFIPDEAQEERRLIAEFIDKRSAINLNHSASKWDDQDKLYSQVKKYLKMDCIKVPLENVAILRDGMVMKIVAYQRFDVDEGAEKKVL